MRILWISITKLILSFCLSLMITPIIFAADNEPPTAASCVACHGPKGQGVTPIYPKLAGQNARYFIMQMADFKQGAASGRLNPLMQNIATGLNDQAILALANYFALNKPIAGYAQKKWIARGQQLFRGGDLQQGIPACGACHGPAGEGNREAGIPALAGQYFEYTMSQLTSYKNGTRKNDLNGMMRGVSSKLSNEDIQAVASYIQGLR